MADQAIVEAMKAMQIAMQQVAEDAKKGREELLKILEKTEDLATTTPIGGKKTFAEKLKPKDFEGVTKLDRREDWDQWQ